GFFVHIVDRTTVRSGSSPYQTYILQFLSVVSFSSEAISRALRPSFPLSIGVSNHPVYHGLHHQSLEPRRHLPFRAMHLPPLNGLDLARLYSLHLITLDPVVREFAVTCRYVPCLNRVAGASIHV